MPVLPPTAASTIANNVVGTCSTLIPRSQVAATNPAKSVVAPPPIEIIRSFRVNPASPSAAQQYSKTCDVFAFSASGTSIPTDVTSGRLARSVPATCLIAAGWTTATLETPNK